MPARGWLSSASSGGWGICCRCFLGRSDMEEGEGNPFEAARSWCSEEEESSGPPADGQRVGGRCTCRHPRRRRRRDGRVTAAIRFPRWNKKRKPKGEGEEEAEQDQERRKN
ncbi:hypothetical protein GW17_00030616 [Ensete ventricosum]|nr:hypothetical protein GW17_00030616 [Ensete ventricosum]